MTTDDEAALRIAYESARHVGIPSEQIDRWLGTMRMCGFVVERQRERAEPTAEICERRSNDAGFDVLWIKPPKIGMKLYAVPAAPSDAKRYLIAFAHYHVNKGDGTDTCKQCGLDLRDQIHFPKWINARIDAAMRGEGGA